MDPRGRNLFLVLIAAQMAHSVKEHVFRLYDVLAPARVIAKRSASAIGRQGAGSRG